MDVFVAFDIETTGFSRDQGGRIIQIAARRFNLQTGEPIDDGFCTFVNPGPGVHIPEPSDYAWRDPRRGHTPGGITGINDAMVKDAPSEADAVAAFKAYIGNDRLVGHNCNFDLSFISGVDPSFIGRPLQDTYHICKMMIPNLAESRPGIGHYTLANLVAVQKLKWAHRRPHHADSDALATGYLFRNMIRLARALPAADLQKLRENEGVKRADLGIFLNDFVGQSTRQTPAAKHKSTRRYLCPTCKRALPATPGTAAPHVAPKHASRRAKPEVVLQP